MSELPKYNELIQPTFEAIKELGGSGKNDEIVKCVLSHLDLPDEMIDLPHGKSGNMTEIAYRIAWARTYLGKYGAIENSAHGVWSLRSEFASVETLDPKKVVTAVNKLYKKSDAPADPSDDNDVIDSPDELQPWIEEISDVLHAMDFFGFERLCKRILRESGFTDVEVTKKVGDKGIDGTGRLEIGGIFSLNVAFQCKRYKGSVGSGDIRDFRGSLTTDIEKAVFITTGTFTQAAKEEAATPGKIRIDLIDGEKLIELLAQFKIGLKPIPCYEVDHEFFDKI